MAKHFTRENFIKLIKWLFPNKKVLDKLQESIVGTLIFNNKEIAEVKTLTTDAWFEDDKLNIDAPGNNYLDESLLLPTKFLNVVYPIGSIYMNVNNVDPNKIFGGTWVRWGKGRMPISIDENDNILKVSEIEGGEQTHKLTVTEIPSHKHNVSKNFDFTVGGIGGSGYSGIPNGYSNWSGKNSYNNAHWTTIYENNVGGSGSHNNMPPYITCYMWKRTG